MYQQKGNPFLTLGSDLGRDMSLAREARNYNIDNQERESFSLPITDFERAFEGPTYIPSTNIRSLYRPMEDLSSLYDNSQMEAMYNQSMISQQLAYQNMIPQQSPYRNIIPQQLPYQNIIPQQQLPYRNIIHQQLAYQNIIQQPPSQSMRQIPSQNNIYQERMRQFLPRKFEQKELVDEQKEMPSYKKIAEIAIIPLENLKSDLENIKEDPSLTSLLKGAIKYLEDTSPEKEAKINSLIEDFKNGYLGEEEYQILLIEFLIGNNNMLESIEDFLEVIPEEKRAVSLASFIKRYGKGLRIKPEWIFLIKKAQKIISKSDEDIDISSMTQNIPLNKIKEILSYGEVVSNFPNSDIFSRNLKYAGKDFTEALEKYVEKRQEEIYNLASRLVFENLEIYLSKISEAKVSPLLKETIAYLKDNSLEKQEAIDKAIKKFLLNRKSSPILTTAFLQGNRAMFDIAEDYLLTFDEGEDRYEALAIFYNNSDFTEKYDLWKIFIKRGNMILNGDIEEAEDFGFFYMFDDLTEEQLKEIIYYETIPNVVNKDILEWNLKYDRRKFIEMAEKHIDLMKEMEFYRLAGGMEGEQLRF